MPRQHRHNPPRRAGFSIIELMVVVAIILILVGIGVVGISQFNAAAEQDVCREIMATALAAMTEYQAQTRGQIPGGDADTSGGDVEEFVTDIKLFDDAETHLDKLASNGYYVGTTIVDPWGPALKYNTQNIAADAAALTTTQTSKPTASRSSSPPVLTATSTPTRTTFTASRL